ncbi:MAG: toll/interleukin-1 receptor domain-containing protein [Candidatus Thiosymbion ectosymbiont of Robbea hypermnestra]|nr:toll/interleukin-1 receptor domain-containing protein [Candidatus Thiosymbion ectosymbiont of Robbea hypermnestra]
MEQSHFLMKRMSMSEKHYDVFLSYSHQDEPWVSEFAAALRAGGVKVWFDAEDLALGERWQDRLQEALRESRALVIVLSPNSIRSPWMFFELGAAVADNKKIIPVLLDDMDWNRVPIPLREFQALKGQSPEEAGNKVAEALEGTFTAN